MGCVIESNIRQKQQELLTSDPAKVIERAQPLAAGLGKMPENGIAGIMLVGIVDVLEPINVDDRGAQGTAGQPTCRERLIE